MYDTLIFLQIQDRGRQKRKECSSKTERQKERALSNENHSGVQISIYCLNASNRELTIYIHINITIEMCLIAFCVKIYFNIFEFLVVVLYCYYSSLPNVLFDFIILKKNNTLLYFYYL